MKSITEEKIKSEENEQEDSKTTSSVKKDDSKKGEVGKTTAYNRYEFDDNELMYDSNALTDKQRKALEFIKNEEIKAAGSKLHKKINTNKKNILKYFDAESHHKVKPVKLNINKFEADLTNYLKKQFWWDLSLIILSALIMTVAFDYFVYPTGKYGIFPSGVGAIATLISNVMPTDLKVESYTWYFIFLILLNLPLLIFAYFKVGKKFSILTIMAVLFQSVFSFIFSSIPILSPDNLIMLIDFQGFTQNGASGTGPLYLIWMLVFAFISGSLYGSAAGLLYLAGSSGAGTDFIAAYYQIKYHKSIASFNKFFNLAIGLSVIAINTILISPDDLLVFFNYTDSNSTSIATLKVEYFFGPTLFSILLFIFTVTIFSNMVYPRFKYNSLSIYTTQGEKIIEGLDFKGVRNAIEISKVSIKINNKMVQIDKLIITASMMDIKKIKNISNVLDPNVKIVLNNTRRTYGEGLVYE